MTTGIILYLDPEGQYFWRSAGATGEGPLPLDDGDACRCALEEDRSLTRLVLPGTRVTSRVLEMPETSEENARAAVSFLMEDHLAVPVNKTHLVSRRLEQGKRLVLAVAHADMEKILADLDQLELRPDEVFVDYQLIGEPGARTACVSNGIYYAVSPDGDGICMDMESLQGLADQQIELDLVPPRDLTRAQLFDLFARPEGEALDLLTGPYGTQASFRDYFKPMMRVAALVLLTFGLYLGHLALEARAWRQAADVLDDQAQLLFTTAFPETRRIVNIRAQLRAHMDQGSGPEDNRFMLLGSRLYGALDQATDVQLDKLRFGAADGRLYVTLSTASFEMLELFKKQLGGGDLLVQDLGARQDGNRISGDFALEVAS